MPADEFYEWMIYERIEPFGGRRGDIQAGIIASTIANVNRSEKTPPFSATDFMPKWDVPQEKLQQTPEQQLAIFMAFAEGHNARVAASGHEG